MVSSPELSHILAFHNDKGVKGGPISLIFEVGIKLIPGQYREPIWQFVQVSNLDCRGTIKWLTGVESLFRTLYLICD